MFFRDCRVETIEVPPDGSSKESFCSSRSLKIPAARKVFEGDAWW
jgi:hypothetical protein